MLSNKKINPTVTELFITGRKINIFLVFITKSYYAVPKNISLNSTYYFTMNIPNKREVQQIAFNQTSDFDFKDFMNIYKKIFFFYLLILLLHQIILCLWERIF